MERKIGEVFEYEGEKLMVVENDGSDCKKCFFYNRDCSLIKDVRGFCSEEFRTDKKCVIFVKSNKEHPQEEQQPQEEKPQELNLCEVLKYCPEGWEFYHVVYGRVWFCCIDLYFSYPIRLSLSEEISDNTGVTSKGTINKDYNGECLLFPSKEQRDWSKFTAPWYKKERFDPKTLKAFDKVIVRLDNMCQWRCDLFSNVYKYNGAVNYICTSGNSYIQCIPYTDETKHLVGTTDEAPEFYKYWED